MEVSRTSLLVRRIGAYLIDNAVIVLTWLGLEQADLLFDGLTPFWVLVLYFPLCEYLLQGRTPGKYALGIVVISGAGGPPTLVQIVIRSATRYIEAGIGIITLFICANSSHCQRIGDMLAQTYVITSKDLEQMRLRMVSLAAS